MEQTRLVQYLKILSAKETELLAAFVESNYHNRNKRCVQLLQALLPYYPGFDGSGVAKEKVYARVFGKEHPYNDQVMRNLCSRLADLVYRFLITENLFWQPVLPDVYLLDELNRRSAYHLFEHQLKQARHNLEKMPVKNEDYLRSHFSLELQALMHYNRRYPDDVPAMIKQKNLNAGIEALGEYYLYYLLNHYLFYLNARNIYQHPFEQEAQWRQAIEVLWQTLPNVSVPVKAYYLLVEMLATGNEKFYLQLKLLLKDFAPQLPDNDVRNCYINLENYCMKAIRDGNEHYLTELLHVYQTEMQLNTHLNPGETTVSVMWLVNAVLIALRTGNIVWAETTLQQCYLNLPQQVQPDIYHFCMANICFYQKKYALAMQFLAVAHPNYYYSTMDIKCLLLRIFYEIDEFDLLYAQIDTFKHYLSNNEDNFPPQRIANTGNFVKFTARLAKLKEYRLKDAEIAAEIAACSQITFRDWLLAKAKEITG
ncbi:hypothetical protein C7N43_00420 [Sphingobacteriales bacterium UPWRP_1]|nr:hypothetical protein BVG80_15350 [Sphingobacteriales bacterium TSM_CSM]PSJ79123.1 hypothetical protein C7N43_00420 [Sphingobacteriales bacterium UPWRP_1]